MVVISPRNGERRRGLRRRPSIDCLRTPESPLPVRGLDRWVRVRDDGEDARRMGLGSPSAMRGASPPLVPWSSPHCQHPALAQIRATKRALTAATASRKWEALYEMTRMKTACRLGTSRGRDRGGVEDGSGSGGRHVRKGNHELTRFETRHSDLLADEEDAETKPAEDTSIVSRTRLKTGSCGLIEIEISSNASSRPVERRY